MLYEKEEFGDYVIEIHWDECPENPREAFDHMGTIVGWSRRYNIGDEMPRGDQREWAIDLAYELDRERIGYWLESIDWAMTDYGEEYFTEMLEKAANDVLEKSVVMFPISHNEYSGEVYFCEKDERPTDFDGDGWIYITKEDVLKEWKRKHWTEKLEEQVVEMLRAEVNQYSNYCCGQVFGFVICKDDEEIDSCWGFYEDVDSVIEYAKEFCK